MTFLVDSPDVEMNASAKDLLLRTAASFFCGLSLGKMFANSFSESVEAGVLFKSIFLGSSMTVAIYTMIMMAGLLILTRRNSMANKFVRTITVFKIIGNAGFMGALMGFMLATSIYQVEATISAWLTFVAATIFVGFWCLSVPAIGLMSVMTNDALSRQWFVQNRRMAAIKICGFLFLIAGVIGFCV
jgi:hypothetical protein